MGTFVVIADSTCDLSMELLEKYDIDYTPMNYTIGTEEFPALLDWSSHSVHDFYESMRCGTIIKTTQVPSIVYEEHFTKWLKEGKDVLYISCSSALSGSINVARIVAKNLVAEYPDRTICCVDSLISSLGQGHLAMVAADMRDEGKTVSEVAEYIESIRLNVNQFATVADLEFLRRAGRVTATSAFFGNFLGIKPIIISDKIGQNYAIKKVKGAVNTRNEIVARIVEAAVEPENNTLYISHADNLTEAEAYRDAILEKVPFKDCIISCIGPIVGASVGPGTVNVYCWGTEVTIEGGK
ncbi:MAG: DegV family protein [Lachnospiraceae bacterium]|nr:DegV family protein [Lachnospiraceae bacterium]